MDEKKSDPIEPQKKSETSENPDTPKPVNVEELLGLVEYKNDSQSHIKIRNADTATSPCVKECKDKPCTNICPAKVYDWEGEQKKIIVNYENCIECGACRMLCPFDNIFCEWPRGGFGVKYKMG